MFDKAALKYVLIYVKGVASDRHPILGFKVIYPQSLA